MIIRKVQIRRFRGIEVLDWDPGSRFSCLVGPGDSTKSTILSAIELTLSPANNVFVNDTDFYMGEVAQPLEITVSVGQVPQELLRDNKFGLEARGWNAQSGLRDEPQEGDELVLSIKVSVDDSLEPNWVVVNDRKPDGEKIGPNDRSALGLIRITADVEQHLSWGRGSALLRLSDSQTNLRQVIADANRKAREIVAGADLEMLKSAVTKAEKAAVALGVKPTKQYLPGLEARAISGRAALLTIYDGAVPVKQSGLGTQRLIALAVQSLAFPEGAIVLIDEIEVGLEPHRICHLLRTLKHATEQPAGSPDNIGHVITTTHSPTVIVELPAQNHGVVRSVAGKTVVGPVSGDLQGTLRKAPEALLGKKVLVCEGKTELGLCRALEQVWIVGRDVPLSHVGTVLLEGDGSGAPLTAKHLASLGYDVALLSDSDRPINPDPASLKILGVQVFQWAGTVSIEERIALDLPLQELKQMIQLAIDIVSSDIAVIDAICSRLGSNRATIGNDIDSWLTNGISEDKIREGIGKAAKARDWFKRIDSGEQLGKVIAPSLPSIQSSDFAEKLTSLGNWVYGQ